MSKRILIVCDLSFFAMGFQQQQQRTPLEHAVARITEQAADCFSNR